MVCVCCCFVFAWLVFSPSSIHSHPHESMCSVCVCSVCGVCMVMQSAQQQVKRSEERRGEERGEQPINQQKQKNKRERESKVREASTKTNKTQKEQKNSGAIAPCVAVSAAFNWRRSAASVGNVHTNGITPALVSA